MLNKRLKNLLIILLSIFLSMGFYRCSTSGSQAKADLKPLYIDPDISKAQSRRERLRKQSLAKKSQDSSSDKKPLVKESQVSFSDKKTYTLDEIILYSFKNNPGLKGSYQQIKSLIYAKEQADKTFQFNPRFKGFVGLHDKPLKLKDGMRYELLLSQKFEIGGQQSSRSQIAFNKQELGKEEFFALKMKTLSKLKYLFYTRLALTRKWQAINEVNFFYKKLVKVTKISRDERQLSDPRAILIQILYNSFLNDYDDVKEELDSNLDELKTVMYYKNNEAIQLKGRINHKPIRLTMDQLNSIAKKSRIDYLRKYRTLWIVDGEKGLEESKIFPEINVFGRYRRDVDDKIYDIGISFPIPILNINSGNIDSKDEQYKAIQLEMKDLEKMIDQDIRIAIRKLNLALGKIRRFQRIILRDTQYRTQLIREFYGSGGTQFSNLLEQERVYQEAVLSYWSNVQKYYRGIFLLEQAIGRVIFFSNKKNQKVKEKYINRGYRNGKEN